MNHKLIPAHRLLPEPSILEKIKALRPESVDEIFDSFQTIAEQRRAAVAAAPLALSLRETFKRAFSDSFFYYFRLWQHTRDTFMKPANVADAASAAMNRDWAVTGDDLRAAINDYIEKHALSDQLILTDKERQSLDYVARDYTKNHPRPAVPAL